MFKKIISVLIAATMLFCCCSVAFAEEKTQTSPLKFNSDGKFKIIHLTDSHLHYPLEPLIKQYITEMLDIEKPDLVVLGGDTITDSASPNEYSQTPIEDGVKKLCTLFTERGIYFTIVFGNHDRQNGKTGEELLAIYKNVGGDYFLGCDAVPELYGEGTHDLQVLSSDGTKVALNLFMFDSGDSAYDENGNRLGYDSVHEDQIEWYKERAALLKSENGGVTVPAMAFQHIIVQEIEDYIFYRVKNSVGDIGEDFDGKHYLFTPIPKIFNVSSGVVMEKPCPGYYNYGQFDAMKETGDVFAIFSGHDHSNTFTVNIDGIDVVNTGGCKYQAALRLFTSGVRVINVDESDPAAYESYMLSLSRLGQSEGSHIFDYDGVSKLDVILTNFWDVVIGSAMKLVHLFQSLKK